MTPPNQSPILSLRARGPLACFTRPELKVERVSYPVITPSAARGLIEAALWKPAIRWQVHRIHVLSDIRFTAFRRNEVNSKAPIPAAAVVAGTSDDPLPVLMADEDRAQRNTVALRDVDYLIEARFTMTDRAGPADNMTKFVDMFRRRVEKGQHFHQPYFGCREFVAEVLPPDAAPAPIDHSRDLGLMLWDLDYSTSRASPIFFHARLDRGILNVPPTLAAALATLDSGDTAAGDHA